MTIVLLLICILFVGCNSREYVDIGKYYCDENFVEIMKHNKIIFSSNFDFTDVEISISGTTNLENRKINEIIDDVFVLNDDKNKIYIDLVDVYYIENEAQISLYFSYDKQAKTLSFFPLSIVYADG